MSSHFLSRPTKKICIIDDDVDYLELLKGSLDDEGFELTTFSKGQLALQAIKKSPPDLVICDWYLRGEMLGSELISKILRISPKSRIIVLSGAITDLITKALEGLTSVELVSKSLNINELISEISERISKFTKLATSAGDGAPFEPGSPRDEP